MDTLIPKYLRINKILLSIAGQWPLQPTVPKYITFFIMLCLTISQSIFQITGAILARSNIDLFMETIPNILVDFSVAAKVANFFFNGHKMKKLLISIQEDWQVFKNNSEIQILNKYGSFANKLTLTYLGVLWGTMTPFMVIPIVPLVFNIFASDNTSIPRQILFAQYEYLFDTEKYYFPVLLHGYFSTFAFINVVVAIDTMSMIYVEHSCAMFSIIGYNLEQIEKNTGVDVNLCPSRSNDLAFQNMIKCIKHHNRVLEYANLIEDAHYISYFFQLGINMICISFTGFQIVMKMDTAPDASIRFAAFTATQLAILLLQSYPGQQLSDHSVQIYQNVYNAGWFKTSLRSKKLFLIMSMRSCIPCTMTAGKFYILNLASFSMVVKSSMSYVMVLLSMKK